MSTAPPADTTAASRPADFSAVGEMLEKLEQERMGRMGYTGSAKKPWEQVVRQQRAERGEGDNPLLNGPAES